MESATALKMGGFTDKPTLKMTEDIFGVEKYINGLSSFILECNTPMTIAIQGDWGSGKTSMMNMIRETLGDKVVPVWFNTWQFSQFNMGDELTLSLLTSLVDSLGLKDEKSDNLKRTLNIIGNIAKRAAVIATDALVSGKIADGLEGALNSDSENQGKSNIAKAISQIKDQFQGCVNMAITQQEKDRVVIFVDDLDRLQPARAVELLEVLKLFLDCDNCVFVLAIDYEVVSQGVKQKFGVTIGEEKGRSFFDKIIQVPFKMPVAQYDITKYVTDMMEKMNITCTEAEAVDYVGIIQTSIGCNPRSMKRLFNAFLLLNKVLPELTQANDWNKKVLFAVLCMQLSFEKIYNYTVSNRYKIDEEFLFSLSDKDKFEKYYESEYLKKEFGITDDNELGRMTRFMKNFNKIVDKDGSMDLSEQEIADFVNVLGFSTITSSTDAISQEISQDIMQCRRQNRHLIKNMNKEIKKATAIEFSVYQSNEDRGDWKFQYACGYKWFYKGGMPYCFDVILKTDIDSKENTRNSMLVIKISPRKQMTSAELFKIFEAWEGEARYSFNREEWGFSKELSLENRQSEEIFDLIYNEALTAVESLKGLYD